MMPAALFAFGCNQVTDAPASIQQVFHEKFPGAKQITWTKKHRHDYLAQFMNDGVKTYAEFTPQGQWEKTESEVSVDDLDGAVTFAIHKRYPDWEITRADRVENNDDSVEFEARLKSGIKHKEIYISPSGEIIN